MSFQDQISADLKEAMRARDATRLSTVRMLSAALKNAQIAAGHELSEGEALSVVQKEAKQRRDSIDQFRQGGRDDLVVKEQVELVILEQYLPEQMDRAAIVAKVRRIMTEVGASSAADKGKVMGPLMQQLLGRADGKLVNEVVTELLSGG